MTLTTVAVIAAADAGLRAAPSHSVAVQLHGQRAKAYARMGMPNQVREAMLAIRGHKGAEGEYNFDKNGDGLHGYNIVKNDKGEIKFDKRIDFTPNLG